MIKGTGDLVSTEVVITTHTGFKLELAGILTVSDKFEFVGYVQFTLDGLDGDDPEIQLLVLASLRIEGIGNVQVDGGFRINSEGLVARAALSLNSDFGAEIGLSFTVNARIELNTTSSEQMLGDAVIRQGFYLELAGEIAFVGIVEAMGSASLFIGPGGLEFQFVLSFNVANVLFFDASGGAGVYTGNADSTKNGLALALAVSVRADVKIASLEASGELIINTTSIDRMLGTVNLTADTFELAVAGKIEVLEVIKVEASFKIVIGFDFWSIDLSLDLDFFGIARLSGSFHLDSTGMFDLRVAGYVSLGGGGTGLFGNFTFNLSNGFLLDVNDIDGDGDTTEIRRDGSGNAFYRFELSGSADVSAKTLRDHTRPPSGSSFSFASPKARGRPRSYSDCYGPHQDSLRQDHQDRPLQDRNACNCPSRSTSPDLLETAPQGYTPDAVSGRELVLNVGGLAEIPVISEILQLS